MKIFDCFLYNGEAEIVSLRFEIMGPYIEKFVIVEANKTFSGIDKPYYFNRDKQQWSKWMDKILFFPISEFPETNDPWHREHYLRDQLRKFVPAKDDDQIIIADADEIINIQAIKHLLPVNSATIVELPTFYHFLNNQSSEIIKVTLIAPFNSLKSIDIGNRNNYESFVLNRIDSKKLQTGGHFTYLFGYNIDKYVIKIQSFSHQEFNNEYFLNPKRIKACINYHLDLFERRQFNYKIINLKKVLPDFYNAIIKCDKYAELIKPTGFLPKIKEFGKLTNIYFITISYRKIRIKLSYIKKRIFY